MPSLSPGFEELLAPWLARQRWYGGKGHDPQLRRVGGIRYEDPAGEVGIETHLLLEESGPQPVLYHVPLTYRGAPEEALDKALIGTTQHSELGTRWIYDGCHDPVYVQALLDLIHDEGRVGSDAGGSASGHCVGEQRPALTARRCEVLSGEQSNTSVVVQTATEGTASGNTVIVKVFRVLHAGDNPDVSVQSALAATGSRLVPAPVGYLSGSWPDERSEGDRASGHLAFAQEFLPDAQDAWRTALEAARAGADFTGPARRLGEATARLHATLREAFGSAPLLQAERQVLMDRMRERHTAAEDQVPALSEHRTRIERVYAEASQVPWPEAQRVHGDYHLGQVLDVPGRGWVLVDFEGEPLRPLPERSAPDLALRDVAGMLRSFDYAAGSVAQEDGLDRADWAAAARTAFLDGYAAQGTDPREQQSLLDALELDKALYEVVYEARNRPGWISLPLSAIASLLDRHDQGEEQQQAGQIRPAQTPGPQPQRAPLDPGQVDQLIQGTHGNPHALLGAHPYDGGVTVRAMRPLASSVSVILPGGQKVAMEHESHGIWTVALPEPAVPDYRFEVTWGDGVPHRQDDPYRYLPTLGETDRHLLIEGRHEQLWTVLGSHIRVYDGPLGRVWGTSFAVWAPHARAAHVVGDFNQWDDTAHPMRVLGESGVWELFIPEVGEGTRYKFAITGPDGQRLLKADPMAREAEVAPASASVVSYSRHDWGDQEWLDQRVEQDPRRGPMSIYEVHLGSWRQGASYRDLADQLVAYVTRLGFTHVEFMPVMQHPYGPSWGYHVTGYYAADSRLGSPDDLKLLIDRLHQAGVGVILDWVPGHFATDPWALARFDGTALYEHPDPRRGWQPEWGSYMFDYGRPQVRNFLVANALFWLEEFHADGLRVDGVASMLYLDYSRGDGEWAPNRFGGRENLEAVQLLQETNATAYKRTSGIVTIAEESTSWPGVTNSTQSGGLGFGLKWNMGWMHDSLDYAGRAPLHRQYHHHQMTFSLMYAFTERFVLPISHDEVVHGKGSLVRKMSGDRWQQLATMRAYLAFMWAHPGKQLLFMGQEFAQISEWADGRSLDWWLLEDPEHQGMQDLVRDLNLAYRQQPALWEADADSEGFQWLDADDAYGNTFSFIRYGAPGPDGSRRQLVALANFAGRPRADVLIGLPSGGRWQEAINTDADGYGGSGVGNLGVVQASDHPHQGQPFSATLTLPPLGVIWLVPEVDHEQ